MTRWTSLALAAALTACGPVVQIGGGAPPPAALYTLSASTAPGTGGAGSATVDLGTAVSVQVPDVPGALRTLRIPVTVSDTEVQYVKAALWSEQPNRLFRQLLAETLAGAGLAVIDSRATGRAADRQLTGQLLAFGADVRGSAPMVRVRYDATLKGPDGVQQRRFEREAAVGRVEAGQVADALNQAANALAADVAAWVAGPAARS